MSSIGIHGGSAGSLTEPVEIESTTLSTAAKQDTLLAELQLKADLTETQPVSGTLTANAGTNLNTSLLALETTQAAQLSRVDTFKTRVDTFTTTTNGVTIDASTSPLSAFGIQVKQTGSVTSWDARLEGSLNNSEFTTILTHTNVTGDGITMWTGALEAPTLYLRSRCAGLVLGAGTNIVVTILGQN